MFSRNSLFRLSALISLIVPGACAIAQNNCCTVTQPPLITVGEAFTIPDARFFSDGCYGFLALDIGAQGLRTVTYDTQTCRFKAAGFVSLPYLTVQSTMALITQANCQLLAVSDTANSLIHLYSFNNCELGAEVQSVTLDGVTSLASNNSCIAALSANYTTLSTFSVDPVTCQLTPANSLTLNAGGVTFSAPKSPCSFVIVIPHIEVNEFFLIPLKGCSLGTPVSYTVGTAAPSAAAVSPNGKCVAVGYGSEQVVRIFTINSDCSLTLVQTVSTQGSFPSALAYSPDGLCLAAGGGPCSIFPVNSDCTLDETNVTVLPIGDTTTAAFSPISTCNLVAFTGSTATLSGAFIFQRTLPCSSLSVELCCADKVSAEGRTAIVITITNTGAAALTDIVVTDLLPSCFCFKQGLGAGWSFAKGNPVIATFKGTLQPGESTQVKLRIEVDCDCATSVENQVTVTSSTTTPQTAVCTIQID